MTKQNLAMNPLLKCFQREIPQIEIHQSSLNQIVTKPVLVVVALTMVPQALTIGPRNAQHGARPVTSVGERITSPVFTDKLTHQNQLIA